jgi:hypothetical protein
MGTRAINRRTFRIFWIAGSQDSPVITGGERDWFASAVTANLVDEFPGHLEALQRWTEDPAMKVGASFKAIRSLVVRTH